MQAGKETPRREPWVVPTLLAVLALLPFARGLVRGGSFFFRDLAGHFFPLRLFAVAGLRAGELRYWNPLTHEGEPLALPPVGYPPDLLQVLWPSEASLSLLLALHLPLAALAAFALARHLGLAVTGAAAVAVAYSLGGFALSSVNLYVYVQALAWAPFVVRGLVRAGPGNAADAAWAALPLAVAFTTTGLEVVLQAVVLGLLLAWPGEKRALLRLGLSLALGFGLAAAAVLPVAALVEGSARGQGFPTEVVLAHSVHPITLLQTVVAGLYADPARFTDSFWGQNFFPRGFPYFLSLYVGVLALGLALRGALERGRAPRLLLALGVLGLAVSLGRYAGLGPLVDALPALGRLRFPSKAFFMVHITLALLLGFAVDRLARSDAAPSWRRAGVLLVALGTVVTLALRLALGLDDMRRYLLAGFFPAELTWPAREAAAASILRDAAVGGLFALAAGFIALLAARGLVTRPRACWLLVGLLAADLLRAGVGLNPMVSPGFFRPSEEARRTAELVREGAGRLFTFDAGYSPAYYAARATRRDHEVWSFAILQEMLVPSFNLALGVPTALSLDQTMLAPETRVLPPGDAAPLALPRVLPRLRRAAVSHVLAVEPLAHPELELVSVSSSPRVAPLRTYLYRVRERVSRFEIEGSGEVRLLFEGAGHLEFEVHVAERARLLLRDTWARGWGARVNGVVTPLERNDGLHRTMSLGPGRQRVELAYWPPGLTGGLALSVASAIAIAALLLRAPRV